MPNPDLRRALGAVLLLGFFVAPAVRAADGDLDPAFGFGGRWTWAAPEGISAGGVVLAPDEQVVALGGYGENTGELNRYLHWKRFSATEAGASCIADPPERVLVTATAADFDSSDRMIVAGGTNGPGGGGLVYLARSLYPACNLDPTFDNDGIVARDLPLDNATVHVLEIVGGGILVLGGGASDSISWDAFALLLLGSGAPDPTWGGGDGVVTWSGSGGNLVEDVADAARDGAGRLLAVGTAGEDFWVSRRLASGAVDPSFGGDGDVLIPFDRPAWNIDRAAAVALDPDGRILVAGTSTAANGDDMIAVARLLPGGALDGGFGAGGVTPGKVLVAIDGTPPDRLEVLDAALQGDGKILLVGRVEVGGDDDLFAVRLTADGSLDASFGGDGRAVHPIDLGGTLDDFAVALTLHEGRPVLVGEAAHEVSRRGILLRLQSAYLFADGFESGGTGAWSSATP